MKACCLEALYTIFVWKFEFKMIFSSRNGGGGKCFSSTQGIGEYSSQKKYSHPFHFLSVERRERKWSYGGWKDPPKGLEKRASPLGHVVGVGWPCPPKGAPLLGPLKKGEGVSPRAIGPWPRWGPWPAWSRSRREPGKLLRHGVLGRRPFFYKKIGEKLVTYIFLIFFKPLHVARAWASWEGGCMYRTPFFEACPYTWKC
jgi:hypothetical protein